MGRWGPRVESSTPGQGAEGVAKISRDHTAPPAPWRPMTRTQAELRFRMTRICYSVVATLPNQKVADEYVTWLEDGHVDAVIDAGAHSAMIVRMEREPGDGLPADARQVMTQYVFSTRETFDRYVATAAPILRAEGMKLFGPDRGVTMKRSIGRIV